MKSKHIELTFSHLSPRVPINQSTEVLLKVQKTNKSFIAVLLLVLERFFGKYWSLQFGEALVFEITTRTKKLYLRDNG